MKIPMIAFLLVAVFAPLGLAAEVIAPGDKMTLTNIPAVPRAVAEKSDRYGEYRSAGFAQWHPTKLEMLVRTRFGETSQVHRVSAPGGAREQVTFFDEPVGGVSAYSEAGGGFFTFARAVGGDEFYQIYRWDLETREATLLSDGVKRNMGGTWSPERRLLAYSRVDAFPDGGAYTEIHVVDPLDPEDVLPLTMQWGGGWAARDWSPDGGRLLCMQRISVNESRVYQVDADSGEVSRLLPPPEHAEVVAYGGGVYAKDGKSVYLTTDQFGEFRGLVRLDLDTGVQHELTADLAWDVDSVSLSEDGTRLAFTVNAAGASALYLMDAASERFERVAGVPIGVIGGLRWHNDNDHLAFGLSSASIAGDVFALTASTGAITRWTYSESGVDTSEFPEPELIEWESFDGLTVSGFLYKPPARFAGARPVVMIIHGGPEGQSRPRFQGRWNYFLNELGVALILPNVRGSTGFGKTYSKLDNGMLREGTYKDIGALLDLIAARDDLDEERVMVRGGSYGGHMTLAVATRYDDRIACSVELYGLSNLRTFLENTQAYRRDLRRVEYGDERIPEMREWMDRTAPMTLVRNIRKPMMVQQGVNDPRVPKSESDQIVASLKEVGTPTWYLVFDDEGHGFRKKRNADFAFYTVILFAQEYLLN